VTLRVCTTALDDDRDLVDLLPERADAAVWLREREGFVAWGTARTLEVGADFDHLPAADGHVGHHARRSGPVDDRATLDRDFCAH